MPKQKIFRVSRLKIGTILFLTVSVLLSLFIFPHRSCMKVDIMLCLGSKQFTSSRVSLSFRYPSYFPLSQPTQQWELENLKKLEEEEALDFSNEFYFNAGGDRLGYILVQRSKFNTLDDFEHDLLTPRIMGQSRDGEDIPVPLPKTKRVVIGNNLQALQIVYTDNQSSFDNLSSKYVIIKNNLEYVISVDGGSKKDKELIFSTLHI